MLLLFFALVCLAPNEPVDLMKAVRDHYKSLKSLSMEIEHHGSSGLFPGEFTQTLRWAKGNRFEQLVQKPNPIATENHAPNYYDDGSAIQSIFPNGRVTSDTVAIAPNHSPGWEVSGGMILSWLQDGPTGKMLFEPPKGLSFAWTYGSKTEWRKLKTRELVATMKSPQGAQEIHFFVDEEKKLLVGFEYDFGKQKGYAVYRNQKENPTLPKTLGNAP